MRKSVIGFFIVVILAGFAGWFVFNNQEKFVEPAPLISQENPDTIFTSADKALPSANWSKPQGASEQTMYGDLKGMEISGQISSEQASINPFENKDELTKMGYKEDLNLSASGPGSNVWGYKKTTNGKSQVVIYSYQTAPSSSNPNEPIQFDCPCNVTLKVFISDPFNEKQ